MEDILSNPHSNTLTNFHITGDFFHILIYIMEDFGNILLRILEVIIHIITTITDIMGITVVIDLKSGNIDKKR